MTHLSLRRILAKDDGELPDAVWRWLRRNVRYMREYPEVVADVPRLLWAPACDCDDYAVAVATWALAGQYPARFCLGWRQGRPVHMWADVQRSGGDWYPVDPTPGVPGPGILPAHVPGSVIEYETIHSVY